MRPIPIASAFVLALCVALPSAEADDALAAKRSKAQTASKNGNYKDALEVYKTFLFDKTQSDKRSGADLQAAVYCLRRLKRENEMDALIEKAVTTHAGNWRFLEAAAEVYRNANHYGYIVAGEFKRGRHRGGGQWGNCFERDRLRAMQLMAQAVKVGLQDENHKDLALFYMRFASILQSGRYGRGAWRLNYKTDLSKLPDVKPGYGYYGGSAPNGAPVDAKGNPIYHTMPDSFEAAKTDGERWRWLLLQAMELDPGQKEAVLDTIANYSKQLYGVQTMSHYGARFMSAQEGDNSSIFALSTLTEDETIARLATGVKRFKLPNDYNYIKIWQTMAAQPTSNYGRRAAVKLAQLFENRRQYPKAAKLWELIKETKRHKQIVGNWGDFESTASHAAGQGAKLQYRFRNGKKVRFEAYPVKLEKLLSDLKDYIKTKPRRLEWRKTSLSQIGHRLVAGNETQYIDAKCADWSMGLKPLKDHFDRQITVTTPMTNAGVYLVKAIMEGGNTSRILVWMNDTVLVRKQFDGRIGYFVADAVTGAPIEKANVEFFGYRQSWVNQKRGGYYKINISNFAEFSDKDGMAIPGTKDLQTNYRWLAVARKGDRLAYIGFQSVWYGNRREQEYNRKRIFTVTDRPVYRPKQTMKFKFWVRHAQYDKGDVSSFADTDYTIRINNPKGEKVLEKIIRSDAWGGVEGQYEIPKNAPLGTYSLYVVNQGGHKTFRVEEYKKPEFQVSVDAPKAPVKLGEKITATIKAKYYFGAPVAKGKVKYRVQRMSHSSTWYPAARWDWLYGRGYWWFCYDYSWYPGWSHWGCVRPVGWWWGRRSTPPELVIEREVKLGKDGTVKVEIDTALAKALHGDIDHRYQITAEVVDESRRTIVGQGSVIVARKPFKVFAWVDRGYYNVGDTIHANFSARTVDSKPVQGEGQLKLYKVSYDKDGKPQEAEVQSWKKATDSNGGAELKLKAPQAGQYRLVYTVTDSKGHKEEGGYVFVVLGEGFNGGADFRFNDLELVNDKKEYQPGDKVKVLINTNRIGSTVLLFVRPTNGVYPKPVVLRLKGKSTTYEVPVTVKDMPNFFLEAITVSNGKVHSQVKEIVVPPAKRILDVKVLPSSKEYKPGEKATVKLQIHDENGKPYTGSMVLTVYDKAVEYISGGSNVGDIRSFYWKWRRRHYPSTQSNVARSFGRLLKKREESMRSLGVFGRILAQTGPRGAELAEGDGAANSFGGAAPGAKSSAGRAMRKAKGGAPRPEAAAAPADSNRSRNKQQDAKAKPAAEVKVRKNFADTAFWKADITTNAEGLAEVSFNMPENLTGWKIHTWAMGHGTRVGHSEVEVVTTKKVLLRMQAPRFFVETDEVVLSANIHNYLKKAKSVKAILEMDGPCLKAMGATETTIEIKAGGEQRVDWRVKVLKEGKVTLRMKALTDEESDAMQMSFPVYVHGMMKTESFSGAIRPEQDKGTLTFNVPKDRRMNESRLEVRYSPTLAGAMVDALPYLVEYPYGCTEQTLSRFLPTVITQKVLMDMKLDLDAIKTKRTNLNAQEIGDDKKRAAGWKMYARNPVFDKAVVQDMVKTGVKRLTRMQLSDGGWGWFSGYGEHSYPHTTAYVVHGLQVALNNDVAIVPSVLKRGIGWLKNYQARQVRMLANAPTETKPYKISASNLDAFVFMVLSDADVVNTAMRDYLYRDRNNLAVYAKAMFGIALHKQQQKEKLAMIMKNISQYVKQDDENQTAWLNLPNGGYWWYWYGSEYEAHAYYLKLLSHTNPKGKLASRIVKYLLNNRKNGSYWKSTRDTAICIEAMADYMRASGEDKPDMTLEVWLDGKKHKEVTINAENLFSFDNKLVLLGDAIETGKHTLELRKKGKGPVYFNAYLSYFSLEENIKKAGLEVKVNRKYYKLKRVKATEKVAGSRGQAIDQKVLKYERQEIKSLSELKSGDLVEIELVIESKNDYEYLIFEDYKPAGFETVNVRSGYIRRGLSAYMELRDEKVAFFVRWLARGKHSVSYRMRAEIPGKFSALPTKGYAMYAPEIKTNSDEIKVVVKD